MLLDYCIDASRPEQRELGVTLQFGLDPERAPGSPQVLFLATWTPGSYLIREYARHLGPVTAIDAESGAALACRKVGKSRFEVVPGAATRSIRVAYRVYAHELTVRTADVTAEHAFWNHACVLLWPVAEPDRSARVRVEHPAHWQLACSLPRANEAGRQGGAAETTTTTLMAGSLDEALDAPCLVGTFTRLDWDIDGVPHGIVLDGLAGIDPPATLLADLTRLVTSARAVFDGTLPYASYVFLCLFTADGHGGLEHASSSTLLASRTAFVSDKGYREFLGLAAHELFHAWNVKRMRPTEFWHYDYEAENYTDLLWLIEGWTAYYDDLLCRRSGLLRRDDYLAILAKNIDVLRSAPGRLQLSLGASSFDAWIRLYRPDENTRNSSQNYYLNGSLAALCLDLFLRERTQGRHGLDEVVRRLYARSHGEGRGYSRSDVDTILGEVGGAPAVQRLAELVDAPLDPDFAATLATVGIRLVDKERERPHLGVTFAPGGTTVASVESGSPAYAAGLSPGDEVLAVQGLRVDAGRWQEVWKAVARIDREVEFLLSRRGVITRCRATPQRSRGSTVLEVDPAATPGQQQHREAWLDPHGRDRAPGSPA